MIRSDRNVPTGFHSNRETKEVLVAEARKRGISVSKLVDNIVVRFLRSQKLLSAGRQQT